jgi:hypothetical protein
MGRRKFDPIKAAGWCVIGLGAGFAGPAIGAALGYGTGAGYGAVWALVSVLRLPRLKLRQKLLRGQD